MTIPSSIVDTSTITLDVMLNPEDDPIPITANLTSTAEYVERLPSVDTGLGPFTDVIHLKSTINIPVTILFPPLPPTVIDFDLEVGDFFLMAGFGIVSQMQMINPEELMLLITDGIRINGVVKQPGELVQYLPALEPGQVARREGTNATGSAAVYVDTVDNRLSYYVMYDDLSSSEFSTEIYGFTFPGGTGQTTLHALPLGLPKSGSWFFTEDQQMAVLMGLTCVQVNSQARRRGELRGQISGGIELSRARSRN
jgi:hypothetical protein